MLLVGHDVEDHRVGGRHRILADMGEVADTLVDILVDDAFCRRDVASLHSHRGREDGDGDAGTDLQRAAGLGAVANHLTSSLRHPKILIKEFSYFLMPCHQHGLRINLLV